MGEKLVCAAVEWARANHRKIVPICSYARAVMKRTPEYRDVFQP
jgi:predicted GNAT family acetyltransferase